MSLSHCPIASQTRRRQPLVVTAEHGKLPRPIASNDGGSDHA